MRNLVCKKIRRASLLLSALVLQCPQFLERRILMRWRTGYTTGRSQPATRISCEPALALLEEGREKAVAQADGLSVQELDAGRDVILQSMYPGLSTVPPSERCERRGHDVQYCSRPRRWQPVAAPQNSPPVESSPSQRNIGTDTSLAFAAPPRTAKRAEKIDVASQSIGSAYWFLEKQCVQFSLPSGLVQQHEMPMNVRSGSRAVSDPSHPDSIFILENGGSRLWQVAIADTITVKELTQGKESSRFKSSLGSRLVVCGSGQTLFVAGTPGPGAHTPWLFDLRSQTWTRLPDAPYPILSSAVSTSGTDIVIAGGWSKQMSCHGHVQTLRMQSSPVWEASASPVVPWRRPGAGCNIEGGMLLALGWMECQGQVGDANFRLLRRSGGAQRARTSSSRLCVVNLGSQNGISELSVFPHADSFEHNGEVYQVGDNFVCIGRDHIQICNLAQLSWSQWRLPKQLGDDNSNSWVKHCGSWALAFKSFVS